MQKIFKHTFNLFIQFSSPFKLHYYKPNYTLHAIIFFLYLIYQQIKLNHMKYNHLIYYILHFTITITLLLNTQLILAQAVDVEEQDSIISIAVSIEQIPTEMVQTRIKTVKLLDENIQRKDLKAKSAANDSLLAEIKVHVNEIKGSTSETKSLRYLENRELQLNTQIDNVKEISDDFSAIIHKMDIASSYFRSEKKRWEATKSELEQNNYSPELLARIDKLNLLLDSAQNEVSERTESVFGILETNANVSIEIEDLLDQLQQRSSSLESTLLKIDRPSIFNLDYSPENITFRKDIILYLKGIYFDLKAYFQNKTTGLYFLLVLSILFSYLAYKNKERLNNLGKNGNSYYQKKLGLILVKPIYATVLLVLILSTIIYKERPLAFRDVLGFLLIIPLLRILHLVFDKKLHKYIKWTFLLMIQILIYVIFPPENVYFRFNLIILAAGELFITTHLYKNITNIFDENHKKNKKILIRTTQIYIIFSTIGLLASIIGNVYLAQIVLFTNYYSIIGGAVIYITSILINGFILSYLNSNYVKKLNAISKYKTTLSKRFMHIINLVLLFNWALIISDQLKIRYTIVNAIIKVMQQDRTLGAITFNLNEILIFVLVIYVSNFIATIIQVFLEDDILNKMPLAKGLPHSIAVLVRYTIITAGVMLAINSAGLSMSNLTVVLGAFGVGIGFGLQNIFNNLVSGLILLFERPVQIGDTVEIGSLVGKVNHIGIRSSNIRTFDGAEVIVPNGNLISNELINWTLSDAQRRVEIIVGVSYDSNPDQVMEILMKIIKEHHFILKQPEPTVFFQELGDSSLNFRMLFWVYSYNDWQKIKSEVTTRVFRDLTDNDIEIPFPQRDIHIRNFEESLTIENNNKPYSREKHQDDRHEIRDRSR